MNRALPPRLLACALVAQLAGYGASPPGMAGSGLAPGAVPGAGSGLAPGAGGPPPAPPAAPLPALPVFPVQPYPFSPAQIAPPTANAPNGAPMAGPPNFVPVPPRVLGPTGRPEPPR